MPRAPIWSLCRALALASFPFWAAACDRDITPAGAAAGDAAPVEGVPQPRVVLGTGWRAFEPRENDEHVLLVAGPQGAHHVWTSFRSYGFERDVLRMSLSLGWDDEPGVRQLMTGNVAARPDLDEDGASTRVTLGWPAVVPEPLCQDGRALRMELTVTSDELQASDSRRWVLDVPLEYRPEECGGAPVSTPAD
jgi:hypothetical protein